MTGSGLRIRTGVIHSNPLFHLAVIPRRFAASQFIEKHSLRLHTSWWPHYWDQALNREPFKQDIQRVVDWLKADHSPLKDLASGINTGPSGSPHAH